MVNTRHYTHSLRVSTMSDLLKVIVLTSVAFSCVCAGRRTKLNEILRNVTECIHRNYHIYVNKTIRLGGRNLPCEGYIKVRTCWGRCESYEYGDYKIPYKVSHHPVCTYANTTSRIATIPNCHPDHPDPSTEVFDADACVCSKCDSEKTSCENLFG